MDASRLRERLGRRGSMLVVVLLAVCALGGGLWWAHALSDTSAADGAGATPGSSASPSSAASPSPTTPADPSQAPSAASVGPSAPDPSASTIGSPVLTPDQITVAPRDVVELPPVSLAATASFGNAVSARVARSVRVDGVGKGIGEISGPAILVTVEFTNASSAPVDLDYVVVNLFGSDGAPGQTLWGDERTKPFSGTLAPGGTRSADFVLRLPASHGPTVTVTVSYGADTPTAVFTGDVAA